MENIFVLLTLVSFVFLIIGIFKPATSLFWYKKERTRKTSLLIYGGLLVASFTLFGITSDKKIHNQTVNGNKSNSLKLDSKEVDNEEKKPTLTKDQLDSIKTAQHEVDSLAEVAKIAEDRTKEIEKQFSSWDGSHINLEKYIKENMNDPDSYEHVETKYWDMKNHLVVVTKFRGKNAYGGKVLNIIKAEVDLQGNVTKIIEQL